MSTAHRIGRILLVCSLMFCTQSLLVVQVLFVLRHDYIATHLCENRFDPHSDCDGFCFLTKQVEKAHHEHEDRQAAAPIVLALLPLLMPEGVTVPPPDVDVFSYPRKVAAPASSGRVSGIFHPPRLG